MFFIACLSFLAASAHACMSWGLPSHSSRSLSHAATYIGTIHWQYWLKNHHAAHAVIIYCTYLAAQMRGQIISPDYYMLLILHIQHR